MPTQFGALPPGYRNTSSLAALLEPWGPARRLGCLRQLRPPLGGFGVVALARIYCELVSISGIFLAKLDGSAKGGVVIGIRDQLGVPVKFVGLGETPDDIEPFDPREFASALFAE